MFKRDTSLFLLGQSYYFGVTMAKGSYNSVGAGETPKCYHGKAPSFMVNDVQDGGNQGFGSVKVTTDLPKVARPSGYGVDMGSASGAPLEAARPGGAQKI
jgi:hypothetical protein